jgi:hypothetical protein
MSFIHSEVSVGPGQSIVVQLDRAANVQVLDASNFSRYQRGERHEYRGGFMTTSPAVITPPPGRWHVAIDLGGGSGRLQASVTVQ